MASELKPKVKTWIANVESGYITNQTEKILKIIRDRTDAVKTDLFSTGSGKISTDELRGYGFKHQTLTAILSILQDEGLIYVAGEKVKGSEYYSYWSYTFGEEKIERLIEERKREKFNAWVKRGLFEFMEFLPTKTLSDLNDALRY